MVDQRQENNASYEPEPASSSSAERQPPLSSASSPKKELMAKNSHYYEVLGIAKTATDDEIKRAYRKLALRYHPDKNIEGDPEKTEKFKEINHANGVLSNPSKRKIYDEYGDVGLKFMEQFSDDDTFMQLAFKPWFKWTFLLCGLATCCCFFCCCGCMFCCQCCCNFCCGKCKPKGMDETAEDGAVPPDIDIEAQYQANGAARGGDAFWNGGSPIIITTQPGAGTASGSDSSPIFPNRRSNGQNSSPSRPTVIAMPPPQSADSSSAPRTPDHIEIGMPTAGNLNSSTERLNPTDSPNKQRNYGTHDIESGF